MAQRLPMSRHGVRTRVSARAREPARKRANQAGTRAQELDTLLDPCVPARHMIAPPAAFENRLSIGRGNRFSLSDHGGWPNGEDGSDTWVVRDGAVGLCVPVDMD